MKKDVPCLEQAASARRPGLLIESSARPASRLRPDAVAPSSEQLVQPAAACAAAVVPMASMRAVELAVEDSRVTGIEQPLDDGRQRHVPLPRNRPARERPGSQCHVAELHVRDQASMCADLLAQSGLGPDMERIQADPHPGPGSDQQRVVERMDEGQVGVQPVGRLDGEGHPAVRGVADQFADCVHVGVRAGIPASRGTRPGQSVHHRRADRRRQVDVLFRAPQRGLGRPSRRQVEAEGTGGRDDLDAVPPSGRDDGLGPRPHGPWSR